MTTDDGNLLRKDPDARMPVVFEYDSDLGVGVLITASSWIVEAMKPSLTDATLLVDEEAIESDGRSTSMRLTGGTLGQWYKITNRFETNENTLPRDDRWVYVLIQ